MTYKVGAEGPSGGLVFWVDETDRSLPHAFEAGTRGLVHGEASSRTLT